MARRSSHSGGSEHVGESFMENEAVEVLLETARTVRGTWIEAVIVSVEKGRTVEVGKPQGSNARWCNISIGWRDIPKRIRYPSTTLPTTPHSNGTSASDVDIPSGQKWNLEKLACPCPGCDDNFNSATELGRHLFIDHPDEQSPTASRCDIIIEDGIIQYTFLAHFIQNSQL